MSCFICMDMNNKSIFIGNHSRNICKRTMTPNTDQIQHASFKPCMAPLNLVWLKLGYHIPIHVPQTKAYRESCNTSSNLMNKASDTWITMTLKHGMQIGNCIHYLIVL